MRRTIMATVVAVLLTAGCSSSGGNDATTTTTESQTTTTTGPATTTAPKTTTTEGSRAGTVSVEEWTSGFCSAFSDWTTGVEDLGVTAERDIAAANTPAEARDAVAATFDGTATLTSDLIDEMSAQDPPDMDDGQGMVDAFTGKFQEFVEVSETSRDQAAAIDLAADDVGEQLNAIYADFETDFGAIGASFGEIDRQYPDPEFQQALTDACGL